MWEQVVARVKVSAIVMLFFLPVAASAWNWALDDWFNQNHHFEAFPINVPAADADYEVESSPAAELPARPARPAQP